LVLRFQFPALNFHCCHGGLLYRPDLTLPGA